MTLDYSSPPKIQPPPLRRPFPITDPRLSREIQDCILYYNNLALTNGRAIIEWVSFSEGLFLGKIVRLPNEKNKVKRCTMQDMREILNIGGRWLKQIRSCENHKSGLVPWEIVRYANILGPLDLPEIPIYGEGGHNERIN